jgi:predicted GH43/DUF377 family glycosyl hydrolase
MKGFEQKANDRMTLSRQGRLVDMYVLSPFVWQAADGNYELLLRAVPRRDDEPRLKMAEIWHGRSTDGLHFDMDAAPVIFPGPDLADLDGCEDPTVVIDDGLVHMWYTGWNQRQLTGRLIHTTGPDATRLAKMGVALESAAPYANPKEATVARAADKSWCMFFEYAEAEASKIGMAAADNLYGPWTVKGPAIESRTDNFDNWHMSTGPVIGAGTANPVMFYNGATRDAHWRIGWAAFNRDLTKVTGRCDDPLITPRDLLEGDTDIAFAASAIEVGQEIWLYYSIADKDIQRATIVRL